LSALSANRPWIFVTLDPGYGCDEVTRFVVQMKLGFEESQTAYGSPSQSARAWTEGWVGKWVFCPNCGNSKINQYPANRPAADFFCASCSEDHELKSQKNKFGIRVLDGAFRTMCARLEATNNPNLLLLNYDLKSFGVTNLFVVPKTLLRARDH
jgi:type II restriction enzyme